MGIVSRKVHLRREILKKLSNQKEEERRKKSRIIKYKLFNSVEFRKAKVIMFYISLDREVDTAEMIREARKKGKIIAVGICDNDKKTLRPVLMGVNERLKKGLYGVKEPLFPKEIPLDSIDLVITPGVAFDKKGMRLGRGLGFYDRFLKQIPPKTYRMGLAFSFQIRKDIPHSKHFDIAVDRVIFA